MSQCSWKQKFLSEAEELHVQQRIAQFEATTGSELKVAISVASDPYPEASFRLAMIISGLSTLSFLSWAHWGHATSVIWTDYPMSEIELLVFLQLLALGAGEILSRFNYFRRLVLNKAVTSVEVKRHAFSLFHQLKVHETKERVGVFLMFSLLEKRIELLVDQGLASKMNEDELSSIVREIEKHFKEAHFEKGLLAAIPMIESRVVQLFPNLKAHSPSSNEVSNSIHWVSE